MQKRIDRAQSPPTSNPPRKKAPHISVGPFRSPRRTVIEQILGGLGPYLGPEAVDSRPQRPLNLEVT